VAFGIVRASEMITTLADHIEFALIASAVIAMWVWYAEEWARKKWFAYLSGE
jgi:hypothetical protein